MGMTIDSCGAGGGCAGRGGAPAACSRWQETAPLLGFCHLRRLCLRDIADSSRHRRPFRPPVRNISLLFVGVKIIGNIKAVYGSYFSGGQ